MLTQKEFKAFGEKGFIIGPDESEEEFLRRFDTLEKQAGASIGGKKLETWEPNCMEQYGVRPNWIPLTYSNKGLLPWQGAAFWTFDGKIPLIQLRKGFKKGKFLFYSRDEVLNHEVLHALRIAFNEPQYEEILAYAHSKSKWRRFMGPLFRKPSHAIFFISLILISLMIQFTSILFLSSPFLPLIKIAALIPFLDLILRFVVLIRDRRILYKTLKKLSKVFPNQKSFFPIAIHLKDSEIQKFATSSTQNILEYMEKEAIQSPRMRQILAQFC